MAPPGPIRTASLDPQEQRIRRSWWLFSGAFFALGLLTALHLAEGRELLDVLIAVLLAVLGITAVFNRQAVRALEAGRRAEAESFARILQGLSRSISPDAILESIVEELGAGSGADHIVVCRRRPDAAVLEVTLVSLRPGVETTTTLMPLGALDEQVAPQPVAISEGIEDPEPEAARRIADRLAAQACELYGLKHALAAPLMSGGRVIGAIVLSRRTADPWPPAVGRVLSAAAVEASAALARVYSHQEAETRATTDALTQLPNRRYFDEFCGLLAQRRRSADTVGVLMIDIDHFKMLNDTHGHGAGDEVLRRVAAAVAAAVREDDVPARYGGEEFAVLLRNATVAVAIEVGERVREAVGRIELPKLGISGISVSVGVAVATSPDQPIADLIDQADAALYRAKNAGRDRVVAA